MSLQKDYLPISGTGVGNTFVAQGVTVGDDNVAIDDIASYKHEGGIGELYVPFQQETDILVRNSTISSITLYTYAKYIKFSPHNAFIRLRGSTGAPYYYGFDSDMLYLTQYTYAWYSYICSEYTSDSGVHGPWTWSLIDTMITGSTGGYLGFKANNVDDYVTAFSDIMYLRINYNIE